MTWLVTGWQWHRQAADIIKLIAAASYFTIDRQVFLWELAPAGSLREGARSPLSSRSLPMRLKSSLYIHAPGHA
ncbi:MAG: hypothetical protein LBE58_14145, partial [Comamonas sp.]|nr:hypothetical protein [Comamonas sp.]